jgi:hypothetical protein
MRLPSLCLIGLACALPTALVSPPAHAQGNGFLGQAQRFLNGPQSSQDQNAYERGREDQRRAEQEGRNRPYDSNGYSYNGREGNENAYRHDYNGNYANQERRPYHQRFSEEGPRNGPPYFGNEDAPGYRSNNWNRGNSSNGNYRDND